MKKLIRKWADDFVKTDLFYDLFGFKRLGCGCFWWRDAKLGRCALGSQQCRQHIYPLGESGLFIKVPKAGESVA